MLGSRQIDMGNSGPDDKVQSPGIFGIVFIVAIVALTIFGFIIGVKEDGIADTLAGVFGGMAEP